MGKHGKPLIITQNGEAKAIIQDIESYEQNLETMALLKICEHSVKAVLLLLKFKQTKNKNPSPEETVLV